MTGSHPHPCSRLLAIDTATEACSAALYVDGEILVRFAEEPRAHGRLILPMMQALLAEAGLMLSNLDALGFGRGPGAFTGVRIATGVIQGVAFGADLPVVPVSTLAALAQQGLDWAARVAADDGASAPSAGPVVLAALDARMGEVYWGGFEADGQGLALPVLPESVCAPAQVEGPADGSRACIGAGRGWAAHGQILVSRLSRPPDILLAEALPHARDFARLAVRDARLGLAVDAGEAIPVYLRDQVTHR